MNDYIGEARKRRQNLLIVEGNHEKNVLFWLIFHCFPEISIDIENVWIYGINIYMLYEDIVKEYGSEWTKDDIDLPFVISKKQKQAVLRYKEDFTNIILIFDYERHDSNFSETKVWELQKYFADAADVGKLYINYPMIESYQHLRALPDTDYAERRIPVSLQPGKEYKALVRKETSIDRIVAFPRKVKELLEEHFEISDELLCEKCFRAILNISDETDMENRIQRILQEALKGDRLLTATHQFMDLVSKTGYAHSSQTYWNYMRSVFKQIIRHNIGKANRVQRGWYQIPDHEYKKVFEKLDLTEILRVQNAASKDPKNGFIWVLNTCIFFVAEYNFVLVEG